MPPRGVRPGTKRARQYEHVKASERQQGRSEAQKLGVPGRSKMNKAQLQRAVDGRKR
jgi:hypothetical protein